VQTAHTRASALNNACDVRKRRDGYSVPELQWKHGLLRLTASSIIGGVSLPTFHMLPDQ